jgi:Tfp pilus assembly protein PilN
MINLLPPEEKRQLRAARTNTLLLRYNVFLASAVAFLGLAIGITYVYLSTTKANSESIINENKAKVASFAEVQSQADIFKANLTTAKQILDNEVIYTKVMLAIAALMPGGTVLDKLSLDSQTFGTPTTLTAGATNYDNALKLKDAFQASALFSDVHFESINSGGQPPYTLTVNLKVTIKKDAAK